MTGLFDPIIREVASPLTAQVLRPLDPRCWWVQSSRALSDTGWSPLRAAARVQRQGPSS